MQRADYTAVSDGAMRPLRLLLCDSMTLIRAGLRVLLSGEGVEIVGEAVTADEAVRLTQKVRPDAVLLDGSAPRKLDSVDPSNLCRSRLRLLVVRIDYRCSVTKLRVPALPIVVSHPDIHDARQVDQRLGIEQQRAVLRLESAEEGFHLRVVLRAPHGVRDAHAVLAQQAREPRVAGEHRILVMMHDGATELDSTSPQGLDGSLPGLQGDRRRRLVADGPTRHHLRLVI